MPMSMPVAASAAARLPPFSDLADLSLLIVTLLRVESAAEG
jgi:hypothetical protein